MVDDEPAILFAYKKILQRYDFVVDATDTKLKCLKLLQEHTYSFAILDMQLNGGTNEDGLALIKQIRKIQPEAVIIMITAFCNREVRERAFSLGADQFFEKPLSTDIIIEAFQKIRFNLDTNSLPLTGTRERTG
ncbi:response regulator [Gemmatimonadota bacterium]